MRFNRKKRCFEVINDTGLITDHVCGDSVREVKANGYLVAAAPDLLETLEEVLPFISNPIYPFHENAMVAQAEKAIAKAKGKK
jgi:hypothetical protein